MKIIKVKPDSLAETIGIQLGDRLLKINGKRVIDELDYKFRMTEKNLVLDLEIDGQLDQIEVEKEYDDDLGVEFEEMKIRSCANDCVFCFVDQNPPNMRNGMYFRDGDYRMSYLYGHFITLTNMGQNELIRIVEQRLSPLYISVHVTDSKLRQKLFLYKKDDSLLEKLKFLTENGIELHTQIVLMPNINDEKYLLGTLRDIYPFYPMLRTCTIVPVGLTKHRKGLMKIPVVGKKYSQYMLEQLPELKKEFSGNQSPFVLCSDEWYILADVPFPDVDEYGDADLLENGVGQVPHFLSRFRSEVLHFPKHIKNPFQVSLVTGTLIADIFTSEIIPVLNKIQNLHVTIIPIKNKFYGESVTVSGLLTGRDIIKQLKEKGMGDEIWVSHRFLNDEGMCTLDDMTMKEISIELQHPVKVGKDSFMQLLNGIKNA